MMKKEGLFEQLTAELTTDLDADVSRLPVRLQILAKAFAGKWDVDKTNQALLEHDCETLYARSWFEASLMYAFDHGISYDDWKKLSEECRKIYENSMEQQSLFSGGKITLNQLKEYVFSESSGTLQTEYLTRMLEQRILSQPDQMEFSVFMEKNMKSFSTVREKARYYFCKYLYYYIQEKSRAYYKACLMTEQQRSQFGGLAEEERGLREKFALEELGFLKPLTKLKKEAEKAKSGMSPEEKREYLENTALTPGGIFDEFNYFYFGYVSADWIEILFELYGEFDLWPDHDRVRIARSLGLCSEQSNEEEKRQALVELSRMAQEQKVREEALDEAYARGSEEKKKLYQRGRAGEDHFREFILGKKDINRGTLISFLLFVHTRIALDEENRITRNRLNRILVNCGFAQLRPDRVFDRFVMDFLNTRDPMDVLEAEVEKQVLQGKNFYLYQVYQGAYCHQKELLQYLS